MIQHYDFNIYVGVDDKKTITFFDESGEEIDLAGMLPLVEMRVSSHYRPDVVVDTLSTANGRIVLKGKGTIEVSFSSSETQIYKNPKYPAEYFDYVIDVTVTTASGQDTDRYLWGHIYPMRGVPDNE